MVKSKTDTNIEVETKILEIDEAKVISTLEFIGAKKILDDITIIESYDLADFSLYRKGKTNFIGKYYPLTLALDIFLATNRLKKLFQNDAYLRLRQEGQKAELVFKYSLNKKNGIKTEKEVSVTIALKEWNALSKKLLSNGFKRVIYQEKKRQSYWYESLGVRFDIDTWPTVPTYLEIEGKDRRTILEAAKLIGYEQKDLSSIKGKELFTRYSASPTYLSFQDGKEQLTHRQIKQLVYNTIKNRAPFLSKAQRTLITNHYLHAEYRGKKTHGLRKLCWDLQFYDQRQSSPKIVKESASLALLRGNKEIGPIAAKICTDLAIKKAKSDGISLVGITGVQRFGVLSTWTEMIAKAGLIGIVTASTEPFAALHETATGVVGTNPLSISIPYRSTPFVFDSAFSQLPINTIWLHKLLSKDLPPNIFLDEKGEYTNNPYTARFVNTFGGFKGSGLSFMLQILSGPLFGMKTHTSFNDPYQNSFYFQAINPTFFQSEKKFNTILACLVKSIKSAPVKNGFSQIHLPGEHSHEKFQKAQQEKNIEIPLNIVNWLRFLRDN